MWHVVELRLFSREPAAYGQINEQGVGVAGEGLVR